MILITRLISWGLKHFRTYSRKGRYHIKTVGVKQLRKRLPYSLLIVFVSYVILMVLSFVFNSGVDRSFLGKWGLLTGFIFLLLALPLHRVTFFGGRGVMGVQTPEISPDEHLHQKLHQQSEREQSHKHRKNQDVCTLSGIFITVIAMFLV